MNTYDENCKLVVPPSYLFTNTLVGVRITAVNISRIQTLIINFCDSDNSVETFASSNIQEGDFE